MATTGEHLGMPLVIDDVDHENRGYFERLATGKLHLQKCAADGLFRYPPATRCPFCGAAESEWHAVEGRGTVYSYSEVHHAIQPAFAPHVPYMVLLVELDAQKGEPGDGDAIRIIGNLATPDGEMAPPDLVSRVGIGSRVRLVTRPAGDGIAIALWCLDETADQPAQPWRYPD